MDMILPLNDLCIYLAELLVAFTCDLVQRSYLLFKEQAGCEQILLDVIEAQDIFNCLVLELDFVLDIA